MPNEQKNNNENKKEIKKFLFVSWESLSGDLAWQIKKEGHEVKIYIKNQKDKDVYDGFLEKVSDWQEHIDWADVVCYDKKTEVLTKDGWKLFKEISKKDKIATLNPSNFTLEYHLPIKLIKYKYEGKMIYYNSSENEFCVTPNHKMFIKDYRGKYIFEKAEDMFQNTRKHIKLNCIWNGSLLNKIKIPEYQVVWFSGKPKQKRTYLYRGCTIKLSHLLAIAGFYISEGAVIKRWRNLNGIRFYQNYGVILENFKKVLNEAQIAFYLTKKENGEEIRIYNGALAKFVTDNFGEGAFKKYIPSWVKELDKKNLLILFEWLMNGDGHRGKHHQFYFSVSKKLLNDMQEILLKIGSAGRIKGKVLSILKYFEPRLKNKKYWLKINYNNYVYCIEVQNHIIYVRRNGKPMWCGNCFDDVGFGAEADNLRKAGKLVVGGSMYTDKLEENREFSQSEMKRVGMLTLPHWDFNNYELALNFIEENPGRYVYKPSGFMASNSKGLLFLGRDEDGKDLHEIIKSNKKVLQERVKQFQLQKFATGVEIAVGAFFNGNDFIYPINVNFEHKKLFPGDIGPFTGEMGCYDKKTEVLTDSGWKFFKDVSKKDGLCTLNPSNNAIEFNKPQEIIKFKHHKELISIKNRTLDIQVTPDHNMYLCSQNDFRGKKYNFKFISAKDMEYQSVIKRTGAWKGVEEKYFILPYLEKKHYEGEKIVSHLISEKSILMDDWLAFLGIWISDGSFSKYQVCVCQKTEEKSRKIKKMLKRLPFDFKENKNIFYTYDKQLVDYLNKFRKSFEKYVPDFIKNLSKRQIEIFLNWYCLGDGTIMRTKNRIFYTSSHKLADGIQELLLKIGRLGIIKQRKPRGRVWTQNHRVNSNRIQYEIHERIKKINSWINKRDIKRIKYNGFVYCASVKNHIMYVRRNGKPYWCGNTLMYWSNPNTIFKLTLEKIKEDIKKSGYVGYIDINCIANARGIYPLEFTTRFGYPTISIQEEGVISEWGDFLFSIAKGNPYELRTKKGFQIGVVCATPPFPYEDKEEMNIYRDLSIIFKKPGLEGIHLGDIKMVDENWRIAGNTGYALVVTGSGATVEDARKQVYGRIENIILQNIFYRTDIGLGWYQDSDKLQTWGYLY